MLQATAAEPRKIVDLETHIRELNLNIEQKYGELSDAHRRRIARLPLRKPVWQLREELEDLHHQFDLALSDYDRRKI